MYRLIDFKRNKLGIIAKVFSIEYDPNRSSRISLLFYADGEKRYILHVNGLLVGDILVSNFNVPIKLGNALPLGRIPLGTDIHNLEFQVRIVLKESFTLRLTFSLIICFSLISLNDLTS